ncbi:MAG: hypothetical protein ACYDBJ_11865 [Aggregatilineales bacterium]
MADFGTNGQNTFGQMGGDGVLFPKVSGQRITFRKMFTKQPPTETTGGGLGLAVPEAGWGGGQKREERTG